MRIIGINGVWRQNEALWEHVYTSFKRHTHVADYKIIEDSGVHPWEIQRLQKFGDFIIETFDDGTPTLLVGHSMGGITACAIANRFRRTWVSGVVTIFSPHTTWGGLFPYLLHAPERLRVPIVTFGAMWDHLVPWGARHPDSLSHVVLSSNHYSDLGTHPEHAETIAIETVRALQLET